jgi:hypothetical protein
VGEYEQRVESIAQHRVGRADLAQERAVGSI